MKNIFIFFVLMSFCCKAEAQDKSNRGKEFWLGYGHSYTFETADGDVAQNSQELILYISAKETANVTVSVNGTSWSRTLTIPANTVDYSILLPKSGAGDCRIMDEGISTKGVHVVSDVPVVIYIHEYNGQLSGGAMLMPVETYGYNYYSVNYTQTQFNNESYSWFFVVAPEDNTRLEITPASDTKAGWIAGQTYTVNLNKGEIYNVFGKITNAISNDMTGSKVVSVQGADGKCHPIAMFSGASIIRFCDGDGGEAMKQQIFPSSAWGTRYITWHMLVNISGNITSPFPNFYRVLVKDPATIVKRNGVPLTGLIKNLYYEFQSTDGDYIEADNPISVAQYSPNANKCVMPSRPENPSLGDPEMFFLSPIEQGINDVTFYSTKNKAITANYVAVIIHKNGIASFTFDGKPLVATNYITHPHNSEYCVIAIRILGPAAQHTIKSDSAFNSLVYGIGIFESYGYTAGTLVNNLNSIGSIQNTYNLTTQPNAYTCPNTPFQLSIKLAYRASSINWQLSKVIGLSPAKDTLIIKPIATDSSFINGREFFTYTLNSNNSFDKIGTYYIPVIYNSPEIDHCSQSENTSITVEVKEGPVTDFSFTHDGCSKDTAYFSNATISNGYIIDRYIWYYDDASMDSADNSKKLLKNPVNKVTYRAIATNGCLKDTTKIINSFAQPVAIANHNRDVCMGDSIQFTTSSTISTGNIVQYNWDLGDGNKKTLTSDAAFFHKYTTTGNYRVTLTVTSDNNCVSDTFTLIVNVLNKPVASIAFSGKPCVDSTLLFTPTVVPAITAAATWEWDFGDGQIFNGNGDANTTHPYALTQTNTSVKFVVTTSPGCTNDTAIAFIDINPNPTAGFNTDKSEYCVGESVDYSDNSKGNIAAWQWNLGNGISNDAPPFSKTYNTAGTNTVQLIVISDKGCSSLPFKQPLIINPSPVADFAITTDNYCLGKTLNFINKSTGNIKDWAWDFGNGTSTDAPPLNRNYAIIGDYNIQLTVTSDKGCISNNISKPITIHPTPTIDFTIDAATYCSGKPIHFNINSNANIATWQWDFGNGTSSSIPPITRNFNAGTYTIKLTGTSDKGCISNSKEQTLIIYQTPQVNAGPDIVLKEGNTAVINASVNNPSFYQYKWVPADGLSSTTILNPVTNTKNTILYTLQVSGGPGNCIATDQVNVTVFKQLYIPNAFTPNGDGTNDTWGIPALSGSSPCAVTIYNRWGQIIFESQGYNRPWDGRFKGQAQPGGAYYYIIQPDINNPEKVSGSVMLIR